ncbi:DUF3073 domain-containing protein [Actinomadura darangshiensis]|uniref:DUF3073 domain-containing protein n=1 Tax=Actinomadura darangshiensis TaxID=705336 RepID=A0A4R5A470_9ACTN|nr:DUF3073 domain-containing protein [Actinomadura darangshiensis]TDD66758.1 DUF3073 domain-containing protein [Actinomadura darangshiensis]
MGRGRAKAKQVKVARQLKYNGGNTDLDRLKDELGVSDSDDDSYDELAEKYADYADEYNSETRKDGTSG